MVAFLCFYPQLSEEKKLDCNNFDKMMCLKSDKKNIYECENEHNSNLQRWRILCVMNSRKTSVYRVSPQKNDSRTINFILILRNFTLGLSGITSRNVGSFRPK